MHLPYLSLSYLSFEHSVLGLQKGIFFEQQGRTLVFFPAALRAFHSSRLLFQIQIWLLHLPKIYLAEWLIGGVYPNHGICFTIRWRRLFQKEPLTTSPEMFSFSRLLLASKRLWWDPWPSFWTKYYILVTNRGFRNYRKNNHRLNQWNIVNWRWFIIIILSNS